jgi:hypothetical protein
MVDQLVAPEHQYRDLVDPPLDPVRMAWPFKTEEELKLLSVWFKKQERLTKKKQIEDHKEKYGKALL